MPKKCELDQKEFVKTGVEALRSAGVRVTKTRLAVLQALSDVEKPQTARELFELIANSEEVGKIDQATVYRILEKFEEFDLVHRVFPSGGYIACFHRDCHSSPHILIRCSSCEDTSELHVPQETLAPMLWYLKGEHGFSPNANPLQINGVCANCEGSLSQP